MRRLLLVAETQDSLPQSLATGSCAKVVYSPSLAATYNRSMKTADQPLQGLAPHIRVLFFDHTASLGGGEIALLNLVRHLDPAKVKPVVVLAANGPLAERLRPTIETYILPLAPNIASIKKDALGVFTLLRIRELFTVFTYARRLARFIRDHNIDLIHTNSLKADIIGGLAGRLARCPVVWHVRDRVEDDYLPAPVVRFFRLLCRVIPAYVIANSAATLRTLHLGANHHSSSIPSGVDLDLKTVVVHDGAQPTAASGDGHSDPEIFRIGLIGRISPWKGQHIFLQAADQVHRRFPQARFVIIGAALFGEDDYERRVRQLSAQLGLEEVFEFAGFRPDVQRAIAELDLVVHASTTGEPFGQVIIEGMAAGKPVVATNGGGVPEIVLDGQTGILVPMGDAPALAEAMCRVLADPVQAKAMGARARQRVIDHFTVEETARRVQAVYEEIFR
jgi:glycosyltransferase involved in cell wall biosynthesis